MTLMQMVLDAFGKYEVPLGWLGKRTHDDMAGIALWAVAEWLESDDAAAVEDLWTQGWTGPCISRFFVTMLRDQGRHVPH